MWGRVTCYTMAPQATIELCKAHEHGEQPESMPDACKKCWTHSVSLLGLHGPDSRSNLFGKHWTLCIDFCAVCFPTNSGYVVHIHSHKQYVAYSQSR